MKPSGPDLDALPRYDALWISPHQFDALLSGAGRLVRHRAFGQTALVVTIFGEESTTELAQTLARLGVDHLQLSLPAAHRRQRCYAALPTRHFGNHASDAEWIESVRRTIEDLGHRTRARDVYLPLGVGGHIDHRLTHEAGARCLPAAPGQNVFFYEDRPYALVPGAVRLRLAQLAIRLPPAITDVGDRAGLLRHLFGFYASPLLRHQSRGLRERLACALRAAASWRHARAWQPRKAFGLRLQPIVDEIDSATTATIAESLDRVEGAIGRRVDSLARLSAATLSYARRLERSGPIERYWLLLPPLAGSAVSSLGEEPTPSL
jgi:LmbE family N-acetylglucosaminyl deacetylase